jgi:hypothetical protein
MCPGLPLAEITVTGQSGRGSGFAAVSPWLSGPPRFLNADEVQGAAGTPAATPEAIRACEDDHVG